MTSSAELRAEALRIGAELAWIGGQRRHWVPFCGIEKLEQMGDLPTGVLTTDQFFRLSQASDNIDRHLILDSQDEIGALVGYLTTNEANSENLVYLSLSGDHFGRPEMLNVINVDLSGFSKGIAALDTACAAPR